MFPLIFILILLALSRSIASLAIDYEWWKEIGQVETWLNLAVYGTAPVLTAAVAAGILSWVAMARGLKSAGEGFGSMPRLIRLATVGALVAGFFIASSTIENWDVVRFIAGRSGGGVDAALFQRAMGLRSLDVYRFDRSGVPAGSAGGPGDWLGEPGKQCVGVIDGRRGVPV